MTLALIVGTLIVTAVIAGYLGWLAWPRLVECPECGAPTVAVSPRRLPRFLRSHAWRRWCAECGWTGLGRRGPDLTDGPVDHESGFRWNQDRSEGAPTFHWAGEDGSETDAGPPEAPPVHPSGFSWAQPDDEDAPPAHPSGFRWSRRADREHADARRSSDVQDAPDDPTGFRWSDGEGA